MTPLQFARCGDNNVRIANSGTSLTSHLRALSEHWQQGAQGEGWGGRNPKCGFQQQEAARASNRAHIPGLARAPDVNAEV
ncbi:unnamed protein product [Prunus armeniaca]